MVSYLRKLVNSMCEEALNIQGGPRKSLWCDLEEKCLRNSKIFFDGVFPFTSSQEVRAF